MWTEQHRARNAARLKHMVSSCVVHEVAGWLERAKSPKNAGFTPIHAVVRAIAWHLRVGGGWRALPPDMPPWRTVYGWFRRCQALSLFECMVRDLARLRRRAAGYRVEPQLAINNTQTVKCISVRGSRGFAASKRTLGRRQMTVVDSDGNGLAIAVVADSVRERGTLPALNNGKVGWPSLRVAILDGAFTAERCREWSNLHGMGHEVVVRPHGQQGFAVLPRRWVVERSSGWLTHCDDLLRDRAGRLDGAACLTIDINCRLLMVNLAPAPV